MTDSNALLADTRATVGRWRHWTIKQTLREPSGWQYGFAADAFENTVLCVCKRELYENLASFMARLVEHDAVRYQPDALVEFVGEAPTYDSAYAFDPYTVRQRGELSTGPSAKGVETDWYELDKDEWGTRLGHWLFEDATLAPTRKPPAGQATLGGHS